MTLLLTHDRTDTQRQTNLRLVTLPAARERRSSWGAVSIAVAIFFAASFTLSGSACLAKTRVSFDTGATVACRDVTTRLFTQDHPDERLIEVPLRISMLIVGEETERIEQLLILVAGPAGRFRVVDYYPTTEMISPMHGPIDTVETSDKSKSLNASLGGAVAVDYPLANVSAKPSLSAGTSSKNSIKETYRRRVPKELLTASGTTNSGHGVFYKLKSSNQTTLEGEQLLLVRVAVPQDWRGDWIRIECRAEAFQKHYFEKNLEVIGRYHNLVGIYQMGDTEAEAAAETLATAHRNARAAAAAAPKKKSDPLKLRSVSRSISRVDNDLEREWKRLFNFTRSSSKQRAAKQRATASSANGSAQRRTTAKIPVKELSPAEQLVFAKETLGRLSGFNREE